MHKFWVGLMDGDGSIQVNHWKFKSLQYRLVIKLKNCSENVAMLNLIAQTIGGSVRLVNKYNFVIWVLNNKKDIYKVIQIFKFYPPLTSRLRAQLAFMLDCFKKEDIIWYLNNRQYKYILYNTNKPLEIKKSYFNEWLSGFIEAKGCFSIRKVHNNHSFSIGQKKWQIYIRQY
uniref:LAGLIDADG homing endonuclease n=1 Tax=Fomitiporia mediterranea TaxID=208960 RepID=A0A5B9RCE3_9AGAM|nr:LAGLIDADG homing endonuclease [Fomitiporia mediterranea]QEG57063.1 LAGLIDADG homing endonuclease [Fomitiporia mediterranea]